MQAIADWIYGIAVLLLLGAVVMHVAPDGAYRKYVQLFAGMLVILAVIRPLLSWTGISEMAVLYYERDLVGAFWGEVSSADMGNTSWQQEAQKQKEAYLEEPLRTLAAEYGFALSSCSVQWDSQGTTLESIVLTVTKTDDSSGTDSESQEGQSIENVEPIQTIRTEDTNRSETESIYYEPSELRTFHEALVTVLGIEEEQIRIYWNR